MSPNKVQSPKSKVQSSQLGQSRSEMTLDNGKTWTWFCVRSLDFGPWTLDFGLQC
jgi:hypothetical protein